MCLSVFVCNNDVLVSVCGAVIISGVHSVHSVNADSPRSVPLALKPSRAVSLPVGCCRPHPPSPFIVITTTTATTILWPFVRDYPGELVPEETFNHPPT